MEGGIFKAWLKSPFWPHLRLDSRQKAGVKGPAGWLPKWSEMGQSKSLKGKTTELNDYSYVSEEERE